jgi:sugar phosphate isomerase/epimerase
MFGRHLESVSFDRDMTEPNFSTDSKLSERMPMSSWTNRLAINEVSTFNWSFEEDILRYSQLGFRSVGVWRYKLHEYGLFKAVDLLEEHQMTVSSLHWAGGFTGGDARNFSESMCDAFDAVEQAAALKAGCLVVLTGGRRNHTTNHAKRISKHALKELCEAAQARNVQIAIEPMHIGCGSDWTFLSEIPETMTMIESLQSPNVGIVFDCYHLGQSDNVVHWLPQIVPHVKLVQVADAKAAPLGEQNRCVPGDGLIPLPEIIQGFEENNYQGFYEIEILGEEVEHLDYTTILDQSASRTQQWLAV